MPTASRYNGNRIAIPRRRRVGASEGVGDSWVDPSGTSIGCPRFAPQKANDRFAVLERSITDAAVDGRRFASRRRSIKSSDRFAFFNRAPVCRIGRLIRNPLCNLMLCRFTSAIPTLSLPMLLQAKANATSHARALRIGMMGMCNHAWKRLTNCVGGGGRAAVESWFLQQTPNYIH